ncbi:hypothetical protein HU723_10150 [Pseudomonas lurida]|uniref:hypothetical protein n=1 Tax=Pseudomonas lurida TaxID=244566 RepID=UPI00164740CE|nr:hypothetical protein [Pseudomonas lurida]MBC3239541.1 hypothetical protein [Pseudomonas lurida]
MIVKVTAANIDKYIDVLIDFYALSRLGFLKLNRGYTKKRLEAYLGIQGNIVLLAENNAQQVVGLLWGEIEKHPLAPLRMSTIRAWYVLEPFRGGIHGIRLFAKFLGLSRFSKSIEISFSDEGAPPLEADPILNRLGFSSHASRKLLLLDDSGAA